MRLVSVAGFNNEGQVCELRILQPTVPALPGDERAKAYKENHRVLDEVRARLNGLNRETLDGLIVQSRLPEYCEPLCQELFATIRKRRKANENAVSPIAALASSSANPGHMHARAQASRAAIAANRACAPPQPVPVLDAWT